MQNKPQLSTFASSKKQIQCAIDAGADHLILEDPELSIRSFLENTPQTEPLHKLIQYAQKHNPNITLSYQCDKICHHKDLNTMKEKLIKLNDLPISTVRIQDLGLISLIKEISPNKNIQFLTETGNQNTESIQFLSQITNGQTLTNELPHYELNTITNSVSTNFEIQVQGPLLIQYSYRRYMNSPKT